MASILAVMVAITVTSPLDAQTSPTKPPGNSSPPGSETRAQVVTGQAVQPLAGCGTNILDRNDDGSTSQVDIGFTVGLTGASYTKLYVNNNGNVTFDGSLGSYTPTQITTGGVRMIAAFWADVDTRGSGSGVVTYGQSTFDARPTFCVNWPNVGYYTNHFDKLNNFQLLLVDRSNTGAGNFDIIFNYDSIQWETGDASNGTGGLGGLSAHVGYSNGTQAGSLELPGSGVVGAFLNGGPNALASRSIGSGIAGRYVFPVRGGSAPVGQIKGTVRAPGGLPLGGGLVYACAAGGCQTTTAAPDGSYTISGLANDTWGLTAFPPPNRNDLLNVERHDLPPLVNGQTLQPYDLTLRQVVLPPPGTTIGPLLNSTLIGGNVVPWDTPLTIFTGGPPNCANVTFTVRGDITGQVLANGLMSEVPASSGNYRGSFTLPQTYHGSATVTIDFGGCRTPILISIYIDPSGTVRDQNGNSIPGATVTLFYSDVQTGPFNQLTNGSPQMSPNNNRNPDATDATGHFGWDVAPGFYKVRAAKAGCTAPGNPNQLFNETAVLAIPPAVTNLDIRLSCPAGASRLNGTVTFQGRGASGDSRWAGPLSVTLYQPGTSTVASAVSVTSDPTGAFTINGISPGNFDVSVKSPQSLGRKVNGLAFNAGGAVNQTFQLALGDINGDNIVNIQDFGILSAAFGKSISQTGYDVRADLNASGAVDIQDFSALSANFNKAGRDAP